LSDQWVIKNNGGESYKFLDSNENGNNSSEPLGYSKGNSKREKTVATSSYIEKKIPEPN
jgi:hypothetical protein